MFFETVLAATDRQTFLSEVFNKRHQLYRQSNRLAGQITIDDIDTYLNQWAGFLDRFVFAALDGESVHITSDENSIASQKEQFEALYRRGATLKIDGFEVRHPVVASLCRSLEVAMGGRVFAKGFLTPPGVKGFDVHFDAYDTFVMQLDGTKHWQVWPALANMPSEDMARQVMSDELGPALAEYTLAPGDVLYMPSGFPHCARCTDQHSLHITIGLNPWRADRMAEFVIRNLAVAHESVRQYVLPVGVDPDAVAKLKVALMDLAARIEIIEPDGLIASYARSANANMPATRSRAFRNASLATQVQSTARFAFDHLAFHAIDVHAGSESVFVRIGCSTAPSKPLHFQPPHVELPAFAEPDLRSIFAKTTPFGVADLDGNLDEESRLTLLTELAKHGVVSIVSAA